MPQGVQPAEVTHAPQRDGPGRLRREWCMQQPTGQTHAALRGLSVFERGWLSSNNILIHAAEGEAGAVLVDTGHVNHAAQTLALVRHALQGQPLARIVNTHLHSDHCGGNALLQGELGAAVAVPPGHAEAVRDWDESALTYRASGQRAARFAAAHTVHPGQSWVAGGREWEALAAPGHDEHSLIYFDRAHGVLLSADALWENGFGAVFPEMVGEPGFDDVAAVLDLIDSLPVRLVVPGHGRPFADVAGALARARRRLAGFQADPARHLHHAAKVLLKYHLMEVHEQALPELQRWAADTPLYRSLCERQARPGRSAQAWLEQLVDELVAQGALARAGLHVRDR
jgi:glyoxylase-like metal-dependent hydrolase (beta-lactamase superfamily II)